MACAAAPSCPRLQSDVPFCQKHEALTSQATFTSPVILQAVIGAGVLALPYSVGVLGWWVPTATTAYLAGTGFLALQPSSHVAWCKCSSA